MSVLYERCRSGFLMKRLDSITHIMNELELRIENRFFNENVQIFLGTLRNMPNCSVIKSENGKKALRSVGAFCTKRK